MELSVQNNKHVQVPNTKIFPKKDLPVSLEDVSEASFEAETNQEKRSKDSP